MNTIAPGVLQRPPARARQGGAVPTDASRLPVGRIGHAKDCALGAICLLCNGYVTAQVLEIDGGQEVMD